MVLMRSLPEGPHLRPPQVTAPAADDADSRSCAQGEAVGEGVFPSAARFNHDCDPNCRVRFDQWGCLTVHARREACPGEELTITYTDSAAPVAVRRAALLKAYGFLCSCGKCLREEAAQAADGGIQGAAGRLQKRWR